MDFNDVEQGPAWFVSDRRLITMGVVEWLQ